MKPSEYYSRAITREVNLLDVADPHLIPKGSVDVDEQMQRCGTNKNGYAILKQQVAARLNKKRKEYAEAYLAENVALTEAALEALGSTKSQKDKIIKARLAGIQFEIDEAESMFRFFQDGDDTMTEWCQIYKKIREVPR